MLETYSLQKKYICKDVCLICLLFLILEVFFQELVFARRLLNSVVSARKQTLLCGSHSISQYHKDVKLQPMSPFYLLPIDDLVLN